jgi:RNA polymerase sigma factor (sigma-70 family)
MANGLMENLLKQLRKVLAPRGKTGESDGELLERFFASHDDAAFELLVWRHHRMVLGVCSRILADSNDVEDAFQATFLVLARKGRSIRRRGSLSSWLFGVARRVALEASRSTRQFPPSRVTPVSSPDPGDELMRQESRGIIDEELGRLPEKYRAPVVLCYLEGMTYAEAGQHLGCSNGTISTRLTRARELLRTRLAGRGLAVSAGSLAAWLGANAASAGAPQSLVISTIRSATSLAAGQATGVISAHVAALTEGVVKAMFLAKLKSATMILGTSAVLFAVAVTCTALAGGQAQRLEPDAQARENISPPLVARRDPIPTQDMGAKEASAQNPAVHALNTADKTEKSAPPGSETKKTAARADENTPKSDRPKEAVKGLTGKVAMKGKLPDQLDKLELEMVLTNEGDQPVRLCTLLIGGQTVGVPGTTVYNIQLRPNPNAETIPKLIENNTVNLKPGESVALRLPKLNPITFIDHRAPPRGDGKCTINATYSLSKEFAEAHQTWQGSISGKITIDLPGAPKTVGDIREQVRIPAFMFELGVTMKAAAFSPDGKLLVTADTGGRSFLFGAGRTHFWDPASGKDLAPLDLDANFRNRPILDDSDCIGFLSFSPDGRTLAGARGHEVCLWDVQTRKLSGRLKGSQDVSQMTFSADGTILATACFGARELQIWGVKAEKVVATLKAQTVGARVLTFSGDGKSLAVCYGDGSIRVWDVKAERETARLGGHSVNGHANRVLALAFEPGDRTVLSAGVDRTIRRWDLTKGKAIPEATATTRLKDAAKLKDAAEPYGLAFGPGLATLAMADEAGLTVWDTKTGALVSSVKEKLRPGVFAFSPDGKWLAVEPGDGGFEVLADPWSPMRIRLVPKAEPGGGTVQVLAVGKPADK